MKRLIFTAIIATLSVFTAFAQEREKKFENDVRLGGGLFLESGHYAYEQNPGAVLRISYGLDVKLNGNWSVMPGAGLRAQMGDVRHLGWVGGDPDGMALADFFVTARYRLQSDDSRTVLGIGPAFSYMIVPDTYYIDAPSPFNPDNLDGEEKFKRWDIGLQPSVTFLQGRHFQWGIEANIGLLNAMRQYPEHGTTGSIHLHYIALTCGWHF